MKTLNSSLFRFTLSLILVIGYGSVTAKPRPAGVANGTKTNTFRLERNKAIRTAFSIYQEMNLDSAGLNKEAFEYAYVGYERLRKRHLLHKATVLSVCDFSQSSSAERMYVIDIFNKKLFYRTFVAHGINSGKEYACSFSNRRNSYKSSLGFYITRQTYHGGNGLSLRIQGMDRGFNDMAGRRNIVIHGAPYVSTRILKKYGLMGTTFGCPAIPDEMSAKIIPVIKKGSCFFIYYPSQKYLAASSVLNG
jgi:hypothetical protein